MFKTAKRLLIALGSSAAFLLITQTGMAHAATRTWTGADCPATDCNFSNTDNWVGGVAPSNGDSLVFSNTGFTEALIADNDMTSASFVDITFSGSTEEIIEIDGNSFTLTGNINHSTTEAVLAVIQNDIVMSGSKTIDVDNIESILEIVGQLSGSGNIAKTGGDGALLLYGDNSSYTGTLTASAGNVFATGEGTLPTAVINDGADFGVFGCNGDDTTFDGDITLNGGSSIITGDLPNPKFGAFYSACLGPGSPTDEFYGMPKYGGVVNLTGTITLASNVTFGANNTTTNITGPLSGAFSITLLDGYPGKLVISSSSNTSNTANGTYNPDPFTATLSDSQPSNSVAIYENAVITIDGTRGDITLLGILKGIGTVGALDMGTSGKLAPGNSPGCLNSGNVSFSGGTFEAELGGTAVCTGYDQLNVTGTVALGTTTTLSTLLFGGFTPAKDNTFAIINNDGSDAVTGTFAGLAEGATLTVSGYVFRISYVGGTGNDVVLTVVTVPTGANAGFGLLTANPWVVLLGAVSAAGSIFWISRSLKQKQVI